MNMKRIFTNISCALVAAAALMAVSCEELNNITTPAEQEKPKEEPVFPEAVSVTVTPGESYTLTVEANLPCEISIPSEKSSLFWLDDDGMPASKLIRSAGTHTIKIETASATIFENAPVCDVTLTMESQSKVIATVTLATTQRLFSVYPCKVKPNGDFVKELGVYVYEEQPSAELSMGLVWGSNFELPVKIEANFDWNVNYPEWVLETVPTSGKAGSTEILIVTNEKTFPTEGASADLTVKAGDTAIDDFKLSLSIQETKSTAEISGRSEYFFDEFGKYIDLNGAEVDHYMINFMSTKGYRVMAVENLGSWYDTEEADWITVVNESEWDDANGRIQTSLFKITVTVNDVEDVRQAAIFFLPESVASAEDFNLDMLFNGDRTQIKEEYASYAVTLSQDSATPVEYISTASTSEVMAEVGAYFQISEETWMAGQFDARYLYQLTYSQEWSYEESTLNLAKPAASYKIFNFDCREVTSDESYWISVWMNADKTQMRISMDPDAHNEEDMQAFVGVYDASGKCQAIIDCRYNESATGGGDAASGPISLVDAMNGSVLTNMDKSTELYMAISSEFGVTDVYDLRIGSNTRVLSSIEFYDMALFGSDLNSEVTWLSIEPYSATEIELFLGSNKEDGNSCLVIFKGASMQNFAAVWVTYDSSIVGVCPFEVTYSLDAKFEPCTDELYEYLEGEFQGATKGNIWQLTYTSADACAYVKFPGREPEDKAAWNNYPPKSDYWLTYEFMSESMGYAIYMSKTGTTDYFVWKAPDTSFQYVLVCKAEY